MTFQQISAAFERSISTTNWGRHGDPYAIASVIGLIVGPGLIVAAWGDLKKRRWLGTANAGLMGRVVRVSFTEISMKPATVRVVHVDLPDGTSRTVEDQQDIGARLVNIGDPVAISVNPATQQIEIAPEGKPPAYLRGALITLVIGLWITVAGVLGFWNRLIVYHVV